MARKASFTIRSPELIEKLAAVHDLSPYDSIDTKLPDIAPANHAPIILDVSAKIDEFKAKIETLSKEVAQKQELSFMDSAQPAGIQAALSKKPNLSKAEEEETKTSPGAKKNEPLTPAQAL